MGTRGTSLEGKVWQKHDTDLSAQSNAKVKNEKELHLLCPKMPPCCAAGQLYFNEAPKFNVKLRKCKFIYRKKQHNNNIVHSHALFTSTSLI
jgi:hypothetical protein